MSVMFCYLAFLNMGENALKACVDLYNAGRLSPEARKALEIIEGLPMED